MIRRGEEERGRRGDASFEAKAEDRLDINKNEIFEEISLSPFLPFSSSQKCPVCGEAARRDEAKFCTVCGHDLREGYAPLDVLRASYNLRETKQKPVLSRPNTVQVKRLFEENVNGASTTAMACVVYSLVPYLGILFCPGALLLGGIGLAVSYQKPQLGGRQTATYSILLGMVVLAVQVLLWWLLYIIPELGRNV